MKKLKKSGLEMMTARPDDHRPDDEDRLVGEDADRGDERREDHEDDEGPVELGDVVRAGLDLLPHDGVALGALREPLGPLGEDGELGVDRDERDRAAPVDLEVLEVGDDDARLLPGHVGEDDIALGLDRRRRELHDVAHRRRALEDLEDPVRPVRRGDDAQVNHGRPSLLRGAAATGVAAAPFRPTPSIG